MSDTILVGVDESAHAACVVDWAAQEATRRGWGLHLLHVSWIEDSYGARAPLPGSASDLPGYLEQLTADLSARMPALPVQVELVTGTPWSELARRSASVGMTVIGSDHASLVARLSGESVGSRLRAHAHSPVVVVRGESLARHAVAVGVDETPSSSDVVACACEEARLRDVPLVVFHAWDYPVPMGDTVWTVPTEPDVYERESRELLHEAVRCAHAQFPEVEIEPVICRGHPSAVAMEVARSAQLLVLGNRTGGWLAGALRGSVSSAAAHEASCPVMLVPHAA